MVQGQELLIFIEGLLGARIQGANQAFDELTILVAIEDLETVLRILRDQGRFSQLMDICGVDYPGREARFEVVYHLLSLAKNERLRVKVCTAGRIPSVIHLYSCANWYERELWDMLGIVVDQHPDLRRLLTEYQFEGHPLRKDFPVMGYVEVRYDENEKRVVHEPISLEQPFRAFDFVSPWEGTLPAALTSAGTDAQQQTPQKKG